MIADDGTGMVVVLALLGLWVFRREVIEWLRGLR